MKYSVIYSSKTGNTAKLAEEINQTLKLEDLIYCGVADDCALGADVIFVGFWTDKGTCCEDFLPFLSQIKNKKIFLFGTAGFGGSDEYFDKIINNVSDNIDKSNRIIGTFMCQGKMPQSVRDRYALMEEKDPDRIKPMIDNFDKALAHPDNNDLSKLKTKVLETINLI